MDDSMNSFADDFMNEINEQRATPASVIDESYNEGNIDWHDKYNENIFNLHSIEPSEFTDHHENKARVFVQPKETCATS